MFITSTKSKIQKPGEDGSWWDNKDVKISVGMIDRQTDEKSLVFDFGSAGCYAIEINELHNIVHLLEKEKY